MHHTAAACFTRNAAADTIQGKRAVWSAQLIVPAMFHGSTSCGTDGIIYEFFTQPVRVVLA